MVDFLSAARVTVALAFMLAASLMDWRTRRVGDRVWLAMGVIGMSLLAYDMFVAESPLGIEGETLGPAHYLLLMPIAILFFDTFREWELEVRGIDILGPVTIAVAAVFIAIPFLIEGATRAVVILAAIPILMLFFIVLYYFRIIHGGADARALMALAIMFPVYPIIDGMPLISYPADYIDMLQIAYPFTFLVLMNAAILHVLAYPLVMLSINLRRGDRGFPQMLMGYRMDLADVPKNFVWPMEVVRDGEIVLLLRPKRGHDVKGELEALKAKGLERVWVTPKAPFMISLTAGLIFSMAVGNLLLLLFPF